MSSTKTKDGQAKSRKVPPKGAAALEALSNGPSRRTVYDFLYHDARRIASFLAQFETYGVLQGVKATETVEQSQANKSTAGAGLSVPMVASGTLSSDLTTTDNETDSAERSYDPLWSNALTLLNYLDTAGLIHRDFPTTRVGQFFSAGGILRILDGSWVRSISANQAITAQALAMAPVAAQAAMSQQIELAKLFPVVVQASLLSDGWAAWMALSPDNMVITPGEIVLKHGYQIAGDWRVLGIVDALPDQGPIPVPMIPPNDPAAAAAVMRQFNTNGAGMVAMQLIPIARMTNGRPASDFGVTPLLIYRAILA